MSPELFQQIEAQGAVVDLSSRAKFRLTGSDRVRFLNGQVTNDVRTATADRAVYACVTDLKGRIVGDIFIHADGDSLLIDAEPDLRDILGRRLERYIIADDVELTDVTDDYQLFHRFGGSPASWIAQDYLIPFWRLDKPMTGRCLSNRLDVDGVDLWLPAKEVALHELRSVNAGQPALKTEADQECFRILRGIPRYPNELNADTFPPEARLDARAMSYTKGCYIGQEILSRIRTTGKMPRTLIRLTSDKPIAAGDEVRSEDKVVGTITSVAQHPITKHFVGLALVKQGTDGGLEAYGGAAIRKL